MILNAVIVRAEANNFSDGGAWKDPKDFVNVLKTADAAKLESINNEFAKLSASDREKYIESYKEYRLNGKTIKKVSLDGFGSKDLKWTKDGELTNGEASTQFDSVRKSLVKISYDEKSKKFTDTFQGKDGGEIEFSFDKGFVDEKGHKAVLGNKDSKNVDIFYNYGKIDYTKGQYSLLNGASLKIDLDKGNSLILKENNFLGNSKGDTVVKVNDDGSVKHQNAEIDVYKNLQKDSNQPASLTKVAEFFSANKGINLFADQDSHSGSSSPYQHIDLTNMNININSKDAYSSVRITSDFNTVKGKGETSYIMNGNSILQFGNDGKIYSYSDSRNLAGIYEVRQLANLDNKDMAKEVFRWQRFEDYGASSLFDIKTRIAGETLLSKTQGMYVTGPRGRVLGGDEGTTTSAVNYDKEFQQGIFRGTEEERRAAILASSDKQFVLNAPETMNAPGQYFSAQVIAQNDFFRAVEGEDKIKTMQAIGDEIISDSLTGKAARFLLGISSSDPTDPATKEAIINKLKPLVGDSSMTNDQKQVLAERAYSGYLFSRNYDPNVDMSNAEQRSQYPINELLYQIESQYPGSIYIPDAASRKDRPSSTGGFSSISVSSEGVFVSTSTDSAGNPVWSQVDLSNVKDPQKVKEALAGLTGSMAYGSMYYADVINQRNTAFAKDPSLAEKYPIVANLPAQAQTYDVYVARIRDARATGNYLLDKGRYERSVMDNTVSQLKTQKRL